MSDRRIKRNVLKQLGSTADYKRQKNFINSSIVFAEELASTLSTQLKEAGLSNEQINKDRFILELDEYIDFIKTGPTFNSTKSLKNMDLSELQDISIFMENFNIKALELQALMASIENGEFQDNTKEV